MSDWQIYTKDQPPENRFKEQLGLELKHGGFINRTAHGCDFLSYRVFPDSLRLSRRSARRLRGGIRDLERRFLDGWIDEGELQQRATAIYAFAATADSVELRRRVASATLLEEY